MHSHPTIPQVPNFLCRKHANKKSHPENWNSSLLKAGNQKTLKLIYRYSLGHWFLNRKKGKTISSVIRKRVWCIFHGNHIAWELILCFECKVQMQSLNILGKKCWQNNWQLQRAKSLNNWKTEALTKSWS